MTQPDNTVSPVVTQADRSWLDEDTWASIPAYMHKHIEKRAARHREAERERCAKVEMPADIAAHVRALGRVEWGQTPAHTDLGHGAHVANSVRLTAERFGQAGAQHMHGLWLEGTETVLCHTGTSPNAPMTTQALVSVWNWLVEQAAIWETPHAE